MQPNNLSHIVTREDYLRQLSNELHKPTKSKFSRRTIVSDHADEIWSMDIVEMTAFASENDGFKYILNAIDVFSRFAYAIPLKSKNASDVLAAFKKIISEAGTKPIKIYTDAGKEFLNEKMKQFLNKNKITQYSTYGEHKASIVERFNRTIKNWLYKEFTANNNRNWTKTLPQLIEYYNYEHIHRGIKMTPDQKKTQVSIPEEKIFTKRKSPKFKLHDVVRVSLAKKVFDRGYEQKWSDEQYTIVGVNHGNIPSYNLRDGNNNDISGSFYEPELQKIKYPNVYPVEKIHKRRTKNGITEVLVSWLGYSNLPKEWIAESQLVG